MKGQDRQACCTVVYDGECAVCQTFYAWTAARDSRGQVQFTAAQAPELMKTAPGVDRERSSRAMAFVRPDGKVVYGVRAVFLTLGQLHGAWGVLGRVMSCPALSLVCGPAYWVFARHRHGLARFTKPGR